jgi:putative MATE family efflux protein
MPKLLQNPVRRTLFQMAFPMLAGTLAMNTYNLVDTWYVSRLGTLSLAAMGLTFPVVSFFTFIAAGIGTGVTTLTSHALGRKDFASASKMITHGFLFILALSLFLAVFGALTVAPIFTPLGADAQTLPLVMRYMKTWYFGAIFMAFPMMGNGILIALGESRMASLFMLTGAVLNVVFDPIFIFGWLGMPALGIQGAALATVLAQAVTSYWLFYLLSKKYGLLKIKLPNLGEFFATLKEILKFAIPGSISMMLMPISVAVLTALISQHGHVAVAAVSAASRVEMFAFVVPMSLGMSLVPFISQNFGADRIDRVHEARQLSIQFALIYGLMIALIFFFTAPWLARLFTKDPEVLRLFSLYVRTVAFGYGMMEVHRYCGFVLTGIHRPVLATLLNMIRVLVLLLPLSFLGSHHIGIQGVFIGRLVTDLSAGIIGIAFLTFYLTPKVKAYHRAANSEPCETLARDAA